MFVRISKPSRPCLLAALATALVLLAGFTPRVQAAISITVQLEVVSDHPVSQKIVTLDVESVQGGESFKFLLGGGRFVQFDAFQVTMLTDKNAPFLALAATEGTRFANAWITFFKVSTEHTEPFLIYHLTDAFISSFQFVGGAGSNLPEVVFTLEFENLHREGSGAGDGLLVPAPPHTLKAITLLIPGLQAGSPVPIDLNSLHVGQTFAVGQTLIDDAFQATMTFDSQTSALLENAFGTGMHFQEAHLVVTKASGEPYVVYLLEDVVISSYAVVVGGGSVPNVEFSLSAATATAHHP